MVRRAGPLDTSTRVRFSSILRKSNEITSPQLVHVMPAFTSILPRGRSFPRILPFLTALTDERQRSNAWSCRSRSSTRETLSAAYRDKHGEDPPDDRYYWARLALTERGGDLHLMNAKLRNYHAACGLKFEESLFSKFELAWKWPHDEDLIGSVLPSIKRFCPTCAKAALPDLLSDTFMEDLLRDIDEP